MRSSLFTFFILAGTAFAAPSAYTPNSVLLLETRAKSLTVYHAVPGTTPVQISSKSVVGFNPGPKERVRVWFSYVFNTPAGSNTPCADPCEVYWNRAFGDSLYWYEYVDSDGNPFNPRKLSPVNTFSGVTGATETAWTLPVEVIGFQGFTRSVQVTVPQEYDVSGTIRLWLQIHALDYHDKALVQVNNSRWISLNNSTVAFLDRADKFGKIGGGFRTMKVSVDLPARTLNTGANIVRFKLGSANNVSIGYRVIRFNLARPSVNILEVVNSNGTATATCSGTCGFSVGQEVYLYGVTHGGAGLNGVKKILTKPSPSTFTFAGAGVPDGIYNKTASITQVQITAWQNLIPQAQFTVDDPSTWTAPANGDAASGAALFSSAPLKDLAADVAPVPHAVQAKCGSCHAQDGRDLKYFGYSNHSIKVRSMFHDLTEQQGDDIAAYIRANNVTRPPNGRPYSPVFQPGAGLDAAAVNAWSAGAGIDAVLERDADLAANLLSADFAASANLNVRETQVPIQYPDWNHWLPRVHPVDGFGEAFTSSTWNTAYADSRATLAGTCGDTSAYRNAEGHMTRMMVGAGSGTGGYVYFVEPYKTSIAQRSSTVSGWEVRRIYSTGQWSAVKLWELNNEFCLEGMHAVVYPGTPDPRGWLSHAMFDVSPNMLALNKVAALPWLSHDETMSYEDAEKNENYLSLAWYATQLTLNWHTGSTGFQRPQDWQYSYGFLHQVSAGANATPLGAYMMYWLVKGLQVTNNNDGGPQDCPTKGFCFSAVDPIKAVYPLHGTTYYNESPVSTRTALLEKYLQAVYDKVITYTPASYHAAITNPREKIARNEVGGGYASRFWWALAQYKYRGVNSILVQAFADWCATIWPSGGQNWNEVKTATCTAYQSDSYGLCSSYR